MMRAMDLKGWPALWAGLLLLGLAVPAVAHNGAVAIAVPVEGIKVDGDLSDWPVGMRRYPIALPEYGDKPKGPEDFQGDFRIGYHAQEKALYVAVEVQDESAVIDAPGELGWDTQDGCEVYIDVAHADDDSLVAQYVMYGKQFQANGPGGKLQDAKVGVKREGNTHSYEWRIDLGGVSQGVVKLGPGMVIGVDVVVGDKDRDGSFSWVAWGRGTGKIVSPDRRGDVVLVASDTPMGKLQGKVSWEDVEAGSKGGNIRIQSSSSPGSWVQVQPDSTGAYEVELPAGAYEVEGRYRRAKTAVAAVTVKEGSIERAEVVVFPRQSLGVTVEAGKGRTVKAGAGIRQGVWQTFDLSDGVPSPDIMMIYQDRKGYLWLGTDGAGASRYDGEQFTTFTTADGLADNEVKSILEDRQGNLWFGTIEGVSRYDGEHFTTFTTADGLADNEVKSILEDRQGNLWFGTFGGG